MTCSSNPGIKVWLPISSGNFSPFPEVVDVDNTEVVSVSKTEGVCFKADVITKPEVEISDYKGLEVKKTVKTVTEDR